MFSLQLKAKNIKNVETQTGDEPKDKIEPGSTRYVSNSVINEALQQEMFKTVDIFD